MATRKHTRTATKSDAITFHNDQKSHPIHRLPFVKVGKSGVSMWHVPQAGNYADDVDIGDAMARAHMQYLRGIDLNLIDSGLQHIVLDMFQVHAKATPKQRAALRAQVVGFFHAIGINLGLALQTLRAPQASEGEIITEANRALQGCGSTKRMLEGGAA